MQPATCPNEEDFRVETREHFYIDGGYVAPAGTGTIDVVSPHTEQVIARVPDGTNADIDRAVAAARKAFDDSEWSRTTAAERSAKIAALSASINARMDEFAKLISSENGSPYSFSIMGQVLSSTMVLDYYAGLAQTFHFEELRPGLMGPSLVRKEPVGVVAAIVPWNVPLFTAMLKIAPALAAGCTVVLKPAPETPLDSYLLAECLDEAGIPAGVVNIVTAGREVGEHLVTHPDIDKIAFTGSTIAGKRIGALAGERLRRLTLELGGKSAAIILDDADLETSIPALLGSSFMNNGQACVAQTRILASRDRYTEIVDAITEFASQQIVGDPLDPATQIGPLVAERQRDRVEGYIATAQKEGGKITTGGGRPSSQSTGWYVEPTVFINVEPDSTLAQEEVFGPVVAVIPYDSPDDAVKIANNSEYGLSGTVFTSDIPAGIDIARRVRTGTFTINGFSLDFGAPFGGYKNSGIGRELGPEGLAAYLESKSICLPAGTEVPGVPTASA
ncbi:MAG: aldehyde dehydrogenase [Frankiaceae bacterium]|nr:aldehyde dehydrogenase [Frankiaceae bacterium]